MHDPKAPPTSGLAETLTGNRKSPEFGWLFAITLAVVLAIVGYQNLIHPNLFPKRFGVVVPGEIYRSGKLTTAALAKVIGEHDIKTVIDLGAWVVDTPENRRASQREQETVEALGAQRFVFQLIGDATGDPNDYAEALRLMIDKNNWPLLVHCGAGTERTGCVVALYRMHTEGMSLKEAYAEAERAGHSEKRNPHLRKVLETWSSPILESLQTGEPIPWSGEPKR
ncbi:hypothetical protein MNBD_PLANCTO03-1657 [hydrothermal vent metagenome]|uniref:Tyrosine specific protein phosphatases domain-containing protein n=1 Tax=hydrothermal vent metagenome TaxID=652676 RepID=A0A3B1DRN7_9ZZZZ